MTYRVIVRPLCQWFTGLVIETVNTRSVVRKIVNPPRWEVDPSIGYAGKNDLIGDVEIDNEIERGSLFSKPSLRNREKSYWRDMTLTGDVRQRVFLGLPSEESRLISNARQGNQSV